jgi:group I intron endonuclease
MIIYKITNTINNKIYIGQSSLTLKQRVNRHLHQSNKNNPKMKICRAIKKYGFSNFKFEIIEDGIFNSILLNEREIYWISLLKSNNKELGYNTLPGGRHASISKNNPGMSNKKHTEESKDKIRKAFKGKKRPQSHIDAMKKYYSNNPNRPKRIVSEESKIKMSLSKSGSNNPWFGKQGHRYGKGINIYQYNLEGILIKQWDNSNIASKKLNIDRLAIDRRCKKKSNKPYMGYLWSYNKNI